MLDFLAAQDLGGNPSQLPVLTANGTAEILSELVIPLADWLHLTWSVEQPVQHSRLLPLRASSLLKVATDMTALRIQCLTHQSRNYIFMFAACSGFFTPV